MWSIWSVQRYWSLSMWLWEQSQSVCPSPHLGHHQLLSLMALLSWDLTPLILGVRSDF